MAEQNSNLDHIYVHGRAESKDFRARGGGKPQIKDVDRRAHGERLRSAAEESFQAFDERKDAAVLHSLELQATGTTIVVRGASAEYPLKLESLSRMGGKNSQPKWLLLSVRGSRNNDLEQATIWVSDAYRNEFLRLFEKFIEEDTKSGKPKNQALIANMSEIREAFIEDLWTSDTDLPGKGKHWWELWLDAQSTRAAQWQTILDVVEIRYQQRGFEISDRVVIWVETTREQLELLLYTALPLVEIRPPNFIDTVEDLPLEEQAEYVEELAERVQAIGDGTVPATGQDASAVCLLDTGVMRTHRLLVQSLSPVDHHTIVGISGVDVHDKGHGTSMAGIVLYADLEPLLRSTHPVYLTHRLESVRMTPKADEPKIDPLDYGSATAEAVSLPEVASRDRRRAFCLTLSTSGGEQPLGEPTLWSSAVDALAVGTDVVRDGKQIKLLSEPDQSRSRLFVVAAGNVSRYREEYRKNCLNEPIHDPAQAWNALTVGAYTDLTQRPTDPQYTGWKTVAEAGDISPHTTTSLCFDQSLWPIKPDICMEGGNVLTDGAGLFEDRHANLSLRSTGRKNDLDLTSANATSAAAAQAARLAAIAMNRYPEYWPETIRGLLTHSAEWTEVMKDRLDQANKKNERQVLLREFGWGTPAEDAVLNSFQNAVTLVTQDSFEPFTGDDHAMRQFRLHPLPWPTDVLESLGDSEVRLRVTLSYFIEPSASRRGWRDKYTYASHGLRFDLQGRLESEQDFISRMGQNADKPKGDSKGSDSDRWLVGQNARSRGSLHQDEWVGSGAELAHCQNLAVWPTSGWWKKNKRKDRRDLPVRYALILSLKTEEQNVDLYTPIVAELNIPVATEIPVS
ncbi:S8 family peptidase [Corynebacterium cystitidis]|uniref:S8 family peptidase n=1 Tax=Corynebacterium cystitidis TaxID=35757 RepID=UPI00211DDAFC|nr:S8 family peptidase [Corynebacterium cystitidis]